MVSLSARRSRYWPVIYPASRVGEQRVSYGTYCTLHHSLQSFERLNRWYGAIIDYATFFARWRALSSAPSQKWLLHHRPVYIASLRPILRKAVRISLRVADP